MMQIQVSHGFFRQRKAIRLESLLQAYEDDMKVTRYPIQQWYVKRFFSSLACTLS